MKTHTQLTLEQRYQIYGLMKTEHNQTGIAAMRTILGDNPEIGIVVLTMLEDDDSVFAAMYAGARGYILKGADKSEVL